MSIVFGHPTGNPNSHHAALAHFERGRLATFVVPWMPSEGTLRVVGVLPPLRPMAQRLSRRRFPPLASAPTVQAPYRELRRLAIRAAGFGDEGLAYDANDWVMRTMARACGRTDVKAVHSYEDASLFAFREAKRLGRACIYDMPIGYYPAWESRMGKLARQFEEWMPRNGLPASPFVRPEQKREEMELADLVLIPSSFVESTIRPFYPTKTLVRAPYGVDLDFWRPGVSDRNARKLKFIYAGHVSLRKGIPLLLDAWESADLRDAELELVGPWQLAESKRTKLPSGVVWHPPMSRESLRERFRSADAFVFASFFEGFGLALLEAMACGLPAIASDATAGGEVLDSTCGQLVRTGDHDAVVDALRSFAQQRDGLAAMGLAARRRAETFTWEHYRETVADAVSRFL
jgi:glycosyltransferase involved in cell wall biosynthesis